MHDSKKSCRSHTLATLTATPLRIIRSAAIRNPQRIEIIRNFQRIETPRRLHCELICSGVAKVLRAALLIASHQHYIAHKNLILEIEYATMHILQTQCFFQRRTFYDFFFFKIKSSKLIVGYLFFFRQVEIFSGK